MPLYEYRCQACGHKFALLVGMTSEEDDERCPVCSSREIARLVSRVSRGRSEDERLDEVADRLETMGEPESYAEVRDTVREVGSAFDENMADEMEEMLEQEE